MAKPIRKSPGETYRQFIARFVDNAPPMSDQQREDIAAPLAPYRVPRSQLLAKNGGVPHAT